MSKVKVKPFDVVEYLTDEKAINGYLNAVLAENDPKLLYVALGDIAKARGMAQIAKEAGVSRESLYKSLSETANPRYETIQKVLNALGVKLSVSPI